MFAGKIKGRHIAYAVYVLLLALACILLTSMAACAQSYGPITNIDPTTFQTGLLNVIEKVGMPIGGCVVFIGVLWTAIQIIVSRFNPNQRENAFHNLFYVGIGAIIFGAALFFASMFFSIGQTYFQT